MDLDKEAWERKNSWLHKDPVQAFVLYVQIELTDQRHAQVIRFESGFPPQNRVLGDVYLNLPKIKYSKEA